MYSRTTFFVAITSCQITCCRLYSSYKIGSAGIVPCGKEATTTWPREGHDGRPGRPASLQHISIRVQVLQAEPGLAMLTWPVTFRDHEIEPAAARCIDRVEVGDAQAHGNRHGRRNCGVTNLGLIGPTNLGTEEDRKRAVARVADDQFRQPVPIQVGHDDLQAESPCSTGLPAQSHRRGRRRAKSCCREHRHWRGPGLDPYSESRRCRATDFRMDRDGGLEGAGLPGDALAVEDVTRPVDDQHILGAVAVDVGDQGRGMKRRGELSGNGERAVAVAQEDRHVVGDEVGDGKVGAAVVGEVTRRGCDSTGSSSDGSKTNRIWRPLKARKGYPISLKTSLSMGQSPSTGWLSEKR